MKRLIYTLAIVALTATASSAQKNSKQERPTPEQRADRFTANMAEKLSLTEDQKTKIKALELDKIKKNDEWRKADMDARKKQDDSRKTYMKDQKDRFENILTAEQKIKLASMRKEGIERMKERVKERRPEGSRKDKRPMPPRKG
ncbi:MAG: DUF4890 domain-containing protein [Sphingobacteriales bacterium]|nr:MAG: DUF4890 domain-containing protein [Sphingobacteriales bacterium]